MSGDPAALCATEALAALRSGALSVEALARACLDRIAARNGEVRAWAFVDPDRVLARARAMDATPPAERRPLHGLPVGVKDVIHTRDMPTRHNSPQYDDPPPTPDAASVAMLRNAGALILGKTATVEFAAIGRPPATRNPCDLGRTPGGSSSGSAAAVADGHVPLALGTQTGGSTIRPASFCGVWGFKPTWGRISNEGCKRFAPTLDTLGWFARSAADLSLLLEAFDPTPEPLPPIPDLSRARIALCRTPSWPRAEPATRDALEDAAERLRRAGAEVVDLALPAPLDRLPELQLRIMRAEGRAAFQPERAWLEGRMREMADGIDVASAGELTKAYDLAAQARAAFDALARPLDAVLAPSANGEAPEGLSATGDFAFQGLWTLLHVPTVNVPGWRGAAGLPVGLTLVGPRFADRRTLAVAGALGALMQV